MKHFFLFFITLLTATTLAAQPNYQPSPQNLQSRAEFRDMGFGIFIHWGIYSVFGQGEWYLSVDSIAQSEYAKAAGAFYPIGFDANEWVRAIKAAGAKYICFTSRHHDGFSMWHTRQSPYNIVQATPFRRDILKELARACHKHGLRLHLYYSLVDWGRADYPLGQSGRGCGKDTTKADYAHYHAFMMAQLTELLTEYGEIGAIWFDGEWDHPEKGFDWRLDELYALVHRLQPACLVANNHHHANRPGEDIQCFERDVPGENLNGYEGKTSISQSLPLETCQTMNYSWGYNARDIWYRPVEELATLLEKTNAKGANLLLNIGPRPDGRLPETARERLRALLQYKQTHTALNPEAFAATINGKPVALYTLTNLHGMQVDITSFGGRIVSLRVPDKHGQLQDVVLGFDNINDYENIPSDFGACIGRYANRLNKGQITINGVPYQLPTNNFGHTLHGGPKGWQYQVYEAEQISNQCLKLTIVSPDGDNGFPGQVTASCTYTLTGDNTLILDYEATTDAPTVINMTNHTYFNLNGDGSTSILNHVLWLNSDQMTPVDNTYMTTGEIVPIPAGDPFDFFTAPKTVGQDIEANNEQLHNGNGYDHNWVLKTTNEPINLAATLYSPVTGIELHVYTQEPGIQVYSGNFLDGTVTGKYGKVYKQRNAICLETQKYPDAPNKTQWPSAFLNPGEQYQTRTTFHFSIQPE